MAKRKPQRSDQWKAIYAAAYVRVAVDYVRGGTGWIWIAENEYTLAEQAVNLANMGIAALKHFDSENK